jgi:hypothetical protein
MDGHIEENHIREHCEERRNDMNAGEKIVGKGVGINGEPNGIIMIKWWHGVQAGMKGTGRRRRRSRRRRRRRRRSGKSRERGLNPKWRRECS